MIVRLPPGPGLQGSPFPPPPPEPRVGLAFTRAPVTGLAPGCLHLRPATGAHQNPKE